MKLDNVSAGYGRAQVLHDVSMELRPGASIAVLGANGAGKSTLAHAIAGAIRVTSGTIHLNGGPIHELSASKRSRAGIGVIPEGRGILPSLSVLDNLKSALLTLRLSRAAERSALDEAVERFPILGARARQRAGTLSGGQQQMLAVSRILARRPRVIIADEVSLGLAPVIVDQVLAELTRINREGVALILIEQFIGRALSLTSDAVVLRQGRVTWSGRSQDASGQVLSEYLGEAARAPVHAATGSDG